MAESFRERGIVFVIYSDDHDPHHCHAKSKEYETRIDISGNEPTLYDERAANAKERKFQKLALKLAEQRYNELKETLEDVINERNSNGN